MSHAAVFWNGVVRTSWIGRHGFAPIKEPQRPMSHCQQSRERRPSSMNWINYCISIRSAQFEKAACTGPTVLTFLDVIKKDGVSWCMQGEPCSWLESINRLMNGQKDWSTYLWATCFVMNVQSAEERQERQCFILAVKHTGHSFDPSDSLSTDQDGEHLPRFPQLPAAAFLRSCQQEFFHTLDTWCILMPWPFWTMCVVWWLDMLRQGWFDIIFAHTFLNRSHSNLGIIGSRRLVIHSVTMPNTKPNFLRRRTDGDLSATFYLQGLSPGPLEGAGSRLGGPITHHGHPMKTRGTSTLPKATKHHLRRRTRSFKRLLARPPRRGTSNLWKVAISVRAEPKNHPCFWLGWAKKNPWNDWGTNTSIVRWMFIG